MIFIQLLKVTEQIPPLVEDFKYCQRHFATFCISQRQIGPG